MSNFFKKTLTATTLALIAGTASAADVDLIFVNNSGERKLDTSFIDGAGRQQGSVGYVTGALQFENRAGASFYAFCVEVAQDYASGRRSFQTYSEDKFSDREINLLQGLFATSFSNSLNATQQAAFQAAVWEITHETIGNPLNVAAGEGAFFVKGLGGATVADRNAFVASVNGYLQAAAGYNGTGLYTITKLHHEVYQDLLTVSAVPEPGSFALLLAGLGVIGFAARRRQS